MIGLVGSLAFAGSKISSDMPHSTASGMVDVIVQYKSFAGANTAEAGRLGRIQRHFRSIPAAHMTVPVSMIQSLASNPQVAYVSPNRKTSSLLDITTQTVNANFLWKARLGRNGRRYRRDR